MAKLLLIDDDFLVSRMYQKVFTFEHFEVVTAFDGEEGLQKARVINPSIIILDIMMPKMNGFEVLDHLKNDPQTKELPVIMLTNFYDQEYVDRALEKGALRYIVKFDYEPKQVVNIVKEILDVVS